MKISRRSLIKSGIGLGALGSLALIKPNDLGAGHSPYFETISKALDQAHYSRPTLVIDLAKLNTNIQTLREHIADKYHYRIVVKSLPSLPLLKHIASQTNSQRFMVFDEHFLQQMLMHFPKSDFLLGKPLPARSAQKVLEQSAGNRDSIIRWLIDSPARLQQYQQLAEQQRQKMRLNLEIDVGLHRGGFSSDSALVNSLQRIHQHPLLTFDGFMGYEPHVVKLPGNSESHLENALSIYAHYVNLAKHTLGDDFPKQVTLNTAGSPSYQLHTRLTADQRFCTELSAGSCLVKPTDFDIATLDDHQAASFIATPILKTLDTAEIPGIPGLADMMVWWNPNLKRSLFTYGGNWKAQPTSPKGLSYNPVYGRSSNQEMLNASLQNPLEMDDWVFLRPTQSEAVFRQFGDIAIFNGEEITEQWSVFS